LNLSSGVTITGAASWTSSLEKRTYVRSEN
jgi:hypothetical protein